MKRVPKYEFQKWVCNIIQEGAGLDLLVTDGPIKFVFISYRDQPH